MDVNRLEEVEDICRVYRDSLERSDGKETLIVENGDYYDERWFV